MIGPITVARDADVAFLVSLAGPGASTDLTAIRHKLAGNANVTIEQLPAINHMLRIAMTGAVGEYDDIAETFASVAMEMIANWIQNRLQES